jgi:protein-S-isoprenylcysteine O-methyltransferase Ste14
MSAHSCPCCRIRPELRYEIFGYGGLMEFPSHLLLVVALWITWCFFHSVMIASAVTAHVKDKLGDRFRFYRLFFNAFALATFCPLALYSFRPKEMPIFVWGGAFVLVQYGLLALSAFLFIAAARHYSLSSFLGLAQIRAGKSNRTLSTAPVFATSGILSIIRHPWYAGGLLFIWARDLGWTALFTNFILSLYLVIGALLEERKLVEEFGDDYRHYQDRVSMLFPWKWLKTKFHRPI